MKRPNLEQDYIFDRSKGDYLHHETHNSYDDDLEAYVDYLESIVKNCSIPDVVKPKGAFCQTPDNCQISYYQQIGDYYCSKCEKTGLA